MKFKVVGKSLILTDYSHKITKGENSFDTVEITVPRYHDNCDLSGLSFRFSEISEDGKNSAVQILRQEKYDEAHVYICGEITSDFSAVTGKVIFMLTGLNEENIVAKFQSAPYTISDDISLMSLPDETTAEQLFNQAQLEAQKAIEAAERAEKASQTPAPAKIYPATEEKLGGVLSGNDISVGNDGTVTVNSVKGKTLGKSVPENAVFTDTVYTLPKATTGILGGVKVDGKTITANEDGTISALDSESLKIKIADVKSSQKSISDFAVQIAHPNNFLIYDDVGKPSVMVAIPKFYLDEVIDGASHTVHPAFIISGVEQDVIYISKYQNIVENGRAYSLPMKTPKAVVTHTNAYNYCKAKGAGWHLMTNAEWAAIALWCKKNGTMPKGNNNYGKDVTEANLPQKAILVKYTSGNNIHTLTGSGRESWYHDGTFAGIADLNGNVAERVSGLRLLDGEINIIADNDAANTNISDESDSEYWKAIMPDGTLVPPGTEGTVKFSGKGSSIRVNAALSFLEPAPQAAAELLEALAIIGHNDSSASDYGNASIAVNRSEEYICLRSRWFSNAAASGIFSMNLDTHRNVANYNIGFRSAYYEV